MFAITNEGKVITSSCLTGATLVAVILTANDDKRELEEKLRSDVFPRMICVEHNELLRLVGDCLHKDRPLHL